nr:hypothetical protein CPGR_02789 [Mycolicibacterium malmesburyense]
MSSTRRGGRDHRRPHRHPEFLVPQRGDPSPGLHRVLDRRCPVAQERRGRLDVGDDVGDAPERRRFCARGARGADDLDDHLAEAEEDLADRPAAEVTVAFPSRGDTDRGERLHGPIQIGGEHHDVVDGRHAVRVPGRGRGSGVRHCRRNAVEFRKRGVGDPSAQRPPDDAGAAVGADQPDAHPAHSAGAVRVDREAGPVPGVRRIGDDELVDGDGNRWHRSSMTPSRLARPRSVRCRWHSSARAPVVCGGAAPCYPGVAAEANSQVFGVPVGRRPDRVALR